jgi:twitching motility protein PilT
MTLESFIALAKENAASDLHLEAGLPAALRIRGALRTVGEPVPAKLLLETAKDLIGSEQWPQFLERRSFDFSKTIQGVRCRINILQTARGVGFAIRLLAAFQATIEKLNLHPDLKRFITPANGLILVSGPTGSGKSSTLAALIQEINLTEARHIVTIESPIEYTFRPRRAYIRQREVGRDTPSFEQALLDALREDPDVLMVGEMRDPQTMRLTLNAAETGHLVLATVHSGTCAEALQRIVAAFPAEIQNSVSAQLADCLVGAVSQRLHYRADLKIRVPECEILVPTNPIKNFIRNRDFFKIISTMETGAQYGMWTFPRYRSWMEKRTNWHIPGQSAEPPDSEPGELVSTPSASPPLVTVPKPAKLESAGKPSPERLSAQSGGRIEIEPVEGGLDELLKKLEK